MDTNGGAPTLTLKDIDNLEDVVEGLLLAEDYDIDIDGLDDLDEIKQRIKCYVRLKDGSPKEKMVSKISRLGDKDSLKRSQLAQMIKEVRNTFPNQGIGTSTMGQNLMEDLLLQDGTTDNIRKDCDVRIESLKAKESVILVAGESSAGKSSLLNLLIGEEILPSHMLPCTSCITVIRYNPYRCARILHKDGTMTKINALDKEGLEELQSRAYFSKKTDKEKEKEIYEQRREEHDIAEIQVFLPIELLKSGLVLVDTPGVGENEFLENYLMDYIYSHQILGFMYIVMTDNALGVAEDRLVNLMSLIIKSQRISSEVVKFDPHAALFVCNRWDMVPVESRATVRQTTLRQLGKCWPDFDDSQAVFFSTFKAEQETAVNPGYITDEYQVLLQGLYSLTKVSLDKRIKASYKWLGTVLQRCVHYLKTMVRRLDMSSRQRHQKSEEIHRKLKVLRSKADTVVERLKRNMEDNVQEICVKVREYLQTPQAKMKLTKCWGRKEGELPDMEQAFGTWDWIKRRIEAAFHDRLTSLLEEWDKDEKIIVSLEKQMFRDAKLQLCDLESDLNELEDQVHEDGISRISRASLLNNLCRSFDDFEIADLLEKDVHEKILHRIMRMVKTKGRRRHANQKMEAYVAKPVQVAEQRSAKMLEHMIKGRDKSLEEFVQEMMVRPFNYIRKLENKIPSMIRSNMTLLDKFEKEIVDQGKRRSDFMQTMERIENIRSELIQYGEGHFFANDFTPDDIDLITSPMTQKALPRKPSVQDLMKMQSSVAKESSLPIPQGLWHAVYLGKVLKEGSEGQFVSVKIYNRDLKMENSAQEVSKLRCLLPNDVCVAEFLGVYQQKETPTPAYMYAGSLLSLKQYIKNSMEADEIKLLVEVLAGLQYIHSKGLVHMDLNKDTVTVDESGNVKLTGACMPRRMTESDSQPCQEYVYISPDVLNGFVYISKADMYSFALLALELRDIRYTAFEDIRAMKLKDFLKLDHVNVLEPHVMASTFQHNIQKKLLKCLDKDLTVRPSAIDMSNDLLHVQKAANLVRKTATPRYIWKTFSSKKR